MRPVLEELARCPLEGPVEQRGRIRTEAAVERKVVRPHEHIHGVDLQQTDTADHPPQHPDVRHATRAGVGESLCDERDPPSLRG